MSRVEFTEEAFPIQKIEKKEHTIRLVLLCICALCVSIYFFYKAFYTPSEQQVEYVPAEAEFAQ